MLAWFYFAPMFICLLCFLQYFRLNRNKKENQWHLLMLAVSFIPVTNFLALIVYLIYFMFRSGYAK